MTEDIRLGDKTASAAAANEHVANSAERVAGAAEVSGRAANSAERVAALAQRIGERMKTEFACTVDEASPEQVYKAVGLCVRDEIMQRWVEGRKRSQDEGRKCLYYLSAEFLIGRALSNNMINLGEYEDYREALASMGFDLADVEDQETDAGLGNGGLGRLAACFLDSLSTLDLPAIGCGIRYEYGFFRQKIEDGMQVEMPDDWISSGDIWEVERDDRVFEVRFGGRVEEKWTDDGKLTVEYHDYQSVYAVPYDMPIVGFDTALPATLRLWSARAPRQLDLSTFNRGDYVNAASDRELAESISKVLYPENSHDEGKRLRLRQFYFLASATVQTIVYSHKHRFGDLHTLPDKIAIQINDTHPALAIPELIRILIDNEGFSWEEAVDIASRTFNYTNHTIMSEALECWPASLLREMLPRIYRIIETLDARFRDRIWQMYPGDTGKVSRMAIIEGGRVRMANLCVMACGKVNGVSQLHGEILKTDVFRDFYTAAPDKFLGITNGVTQRRWLQVANPGLAKLVDDTIGCGFMKDWRKLDELVPSADDAAFRDAFAQVKATAKRSFATWLSDAQGTVIDPDTIFDVQAKRLHEYKRQLLKVLHILSLFDGITSGRITDCPKTTFIFAAKAAPGYYRAKEIIRLINATAALIASDERTRDVIPVVFLENYGVSSAQRLIPAADISEQISTAGREASGTGNMKFMLNGALTLGTMDGANIEILERVGEQNIFIFGRTVDQLRAIERDRSYVPAQVADADPRISGALHHLIDGSLPTHDGRSFEDIYWSLRPDAGQGDPYFVLLDFDAYDRRWFDTVRAYGDRDSWMHKAVINTARSGYFSSDRAIGEYNDVIWHLLPLDRS